MASCSTELQVISQHVGASTSSSAVILDPDRIPLTLRERLLKTLNCANCKAVFNSPISTCKSGHSNCYTCTTRYNKCGVCNSELVCIRNYTIEAQLALIDVECQIALCTQRVKASKLYDHFAVCEFRPIHCQLPITSTIMGMSGARVDCNAVYRFEEYMYHLTQVHAVARYEFMDPNGFYDFPCTANGEDFFRTNDSPWYMTAPLPLLVGAKTFLLHRQLKHHGFMVWVTAMFAEEEALEYAVTIHLVHRHNFDPKGKFPRWEVHPHNYHTKKQIAIDADDYVTMQPTLLRQYAEIDAGIWHWTIICNIKKRPVNKPDLLEYVID